MFAQFICALLGFRAHDFPMISKKNPWTFIVDQRSYVYPESARTWYVYIYFHVFPIFFGLTMTLLLCLFPVIRFNKVY